MRQFGMRQFGMGHTLKQGGGGYSLADMIALFDGGYTGTLLDPVSLDSMWQDSLDGTPAALDAPVGEWRALAGGGHFTASSTARPTLRRTGAAYYVEGDGVNDIMTAAAPLIPAAPPFTIMISAEFANGTVGALLAQYAVGQAGRLAFAVNQNASGSALAGGFNPFINGVTQGAGPSGVPQHQTPGNGNRFVHTFHAAAGAEQSYHALNGTEIDRFTVATVYQGANTELFGNSVVGFTSVKRLYGLLIIDRLLSEAEERRARHFFAQRVGPTATDDAIAAAFAAMDVSPPSAHDSAYRALITGLVDDGIWDNLHHLGIFWAHDQQAARVDIKAPSRVATVVGNGGLGPDFLVNGGFTGNADDAYLDWGVDLATMGVTVDDHAMLTWGMSDVARDANWDIGTATGSEARVNPRTGLSNLSVSAGRNLTTTIGPTTGGDPYDSLGLSGYSRSGASAFRLLKNGVSQATFTSGSTGLGSGNLVTLHSNSANFSNRMVGAQAVLRNISDADHLKLYNRLLDFKEAVSVAPSVFLQHHILGDSFVNQDTTNDYKTAMDQPNLSVSFDGVGGSTLSEQYTRFQATPARYDRFLTVMDGGLDSTAAVAIEKVLAMADLLSHDKWLYVQSVIHASVTLSNPDRAARDQTEVDIQAGLGNRYVETHQALLDANDGSADDLTDVANGICPRSLRYDAQHLNSAGMQVLYACVKARMFELWPTELAALGWVE